MKNRLKKIAIGIVILLNAPSIINGQSEQIVDLSTGVVNGTSNLIAPGSFDDTWQITSPSSGPYQDVKCTDGTRRILNLYSNTLYNPGWPTVPTARWLSPSVVSQGGFVSAYENESNSYDNYLEDYTYKMTFNREDCNVANAQIVLNSIGGDNTVTSINVNGNTHPLNNVNFNPLTQNVTITVPPSELIAGTNIITAVVHNETQWVGFMLSGMLIINYSASPTIIGNNFSCSTAPEIYTLGGSYNPAFTYNWTVTGGTPATFTSNSPTLAVTWPVGSDGIAPGGTISVSAGAGCTPTIFTVKQCCRVNVTGKTTVYLNDKTETASITYSGLNNIVVVNGTYNVNSNINYLNCPTYFAPNAQVNVNSIGNLNLLLGTVWQAGCDYMWNGIVVNSSGTGATQLLVETSTIQDAKTAITSNSGARFTLTSGAKLNRNYRGIVVNTFAGTHPGLIKNSTISCRNDAGTANQNITLPPYANQRSYSGIEVNGVNQINIGLAAASETTYFRNLDMGIISTNSGLTVYNCDFNDIPYSTNKGRAIKASNSGTTERAVIVGGTAANQSNTFANCCFGVLTAGTNNMDLTIVNNTFNNLGEAAQIVNCRGIDNQIVFNNNTINDCSYGLHAVGNEGSKTFDVIGNTINNTIVNAKPNSQGLSIENTVSAVVAQYKPYLNVRGNTAKSVLTGIRVTNFNTPYIENNVITALSDLGAGYQTNGVLVTKSPSANIRSNTVKGSSANAWWENGIHVEPGCPGAKVISNTVETIGRGLFFSGTDNVGIETAKNQMKNNYDGFLLNYAAIGYQLGSANACLASENTWEGIIHSHLHSYWSDGAASPHHLFGTPNSTPGPNMNPIGINSTVDPINQSGVTAIPYSNCSSFSGYKMSNPKLDQLTEIAEDKISYPIYESSSKWMSKYALYKTLQADPSLLANSDLQNFANDIKSTNIATLDKVNDMLANGDADISSAEGIVNGVVAENVVEQNLKEVFAITILNRKNNNSLNATQIKRLKEIAAQCPYEGGPGVHNARVLLSLDDNTVYVNSCEIAPPANARTGAFASAISNSMDIVISPNPNNGSFKLSMNLDNKKDIVIYDVMGKVVFEKHNTIEQTINVDITNEAKGIYFVKVITSEGIVLKKIVNQ